MSTEPKYSPEPWDMYARLVYADGSEATSTLADAAIWMSAEARANLALMQESPGLYRALAALVDKLDSGQPADITTELAEAKAVLAKARGRGEVPHE